MFTSKARLFVISACALFALTAATPAFAQTGESSSNTRTSGQQTGTQPAGAQGGTRPMGGPDMGPRLFVFGNLAFGGKLETEVDQELSANGQTQSTSGEVDYGDLELTNGLGAHFGVPVHRLFTIGGRISYVTYKSEDFDDLDIDRLSLVNIDAAPKVRYPLAGGSAEIYATIPVGISLNFPNDSINDNSVGDVEYNTALSWNISVLGGASYKLSPNIGIFAEGGLYNQYIKLTAEGTVQGADAEVTETGSFSQFGLLAGAFFSF